MPQLTLATAQQGPKGNTGATGPTGPAAPGLWVPSENGLIAAVDDPARASTNAAMGAGVLYLARVKMAVDSIITNLHCMPRSAAGVGVANAFMGVYTVSGTTATLLGQTADLSTPMQSAANVKAALTAPTASQAAGTVLLIGLLVGSATTTPTTRNVPIGDANNNLTSSAPYRCATLSPGSFTALPATFAITSMGVGGTFPWVAAS